MIVEIPLWLLVLLMLMSSPAVIGATIIGVGMLVLAFRNRRKT